MEELKNRFDSSEMKEKLELFKAETFLPQLSPNKDIPEIIQKLLILANIKNLDPVTIAEYSVILETYSLYLIMEENRCNSYLNWCESNLKHIVGKKCQEVPPAYFSEKDIYIRANDDNAVFLEEQKLIAQTKLDTIKGVSSKLKFIGDNLRGLAYAKKQMFRN